MYEEFVKPLLPEGALWDAHTHIGADDDGAALTGPNLIEELCAHGVRHAFTFPFRAPHEDYPRLNREVLAASRASDGMLIPFCRSEPGGDYSHDIAAALAAGARGIKLHPADGVFTCGHGCADTAFAMAADHDVPVLLHAGRGLASPVEDLERLLERHPGVRVILAHCAIADMDAVATRLAGATFVVDTSVWNTTDMYAALATFTPQQIVYGTDAPYYRASIIQAKLALALDRLGSLPAQMDAIFAGNARRMLEGGPAPEASAPLGDAGCTLSPRLRRVHDYLLMAAMFIWRREPDRVGALALAYQALSDGDRFERMARNLALQAHELWADETASPPRVESLGLSLRTYRLVELADALLIGAGR